MRLIAFCLLLGGCASSPSVVSVPVALSCIPTGLPAPPSLRSDSELAGMSDYALVTTIAAERLDLLSYARQITPILESCK